MTLLRWLVGPDVDNADPRTHICEIVCDGVVVPVPIGHDGWVGQRFVEPGDPIPLDGLLALGSGNGPGARLPDGYETAPSYSAADVGREARLADFEVFVSYRKRDAEIAADTIARRIDAHVGHQTAFLAPGSIPLGVDFLESIHDALQRARVLVVVIGNQWLGQTDEHGRRRIDSRADVARIEVQAGLDRGIPVVPLVVEGATLPPAAGLPPTTAQLARSQGYFVRTENLDSDLDSAITAIARYL